MGLSHASMGTNMLDGLYTLLVAFVCTGVIFAVLRIMPRPHFIRKRWIAMKVAAGTSAVIMALFFGAFYTGLITGL
jgi:hypothetical protein